MNSTQLMGIVRDFIKIVGVFVVAFGYVDESTWEMASGAILTAAASLWSWYTNATTTMLSAVASDPEVKKVVATPTLVKSAANPKVTTK